VTWVLASVMLAAAAPPVLWPLIAHWQPRLQPAVAVDAREARLRELEEIELDLAAGRISEREAALRRRELK
jgi:hypothetical protein